MTYDKSREKKLLEAIEIAERHGNYFMAQNIRRALQELKTGYLQRPGASDVF